MTMEWAEAHNRKVALGRKPPVAPPPATEPLSTPPAPKQAPESLPEAKNGDVNGGLKVKTIQFTARIAPMGAVRLNRYDKWKKRPVVLRYHAFRDSLRLAMQTQVGQIPPPDELIVKAFIRMPDSWPKNKKARLVGERHKQKPDADNLGKAAQDALWEDDSVISDLIISKRWCAPGNERLEIVCVYFDSN